MRYNRSFLCFMICIFSIGATVFLYLSCGSTNGGEDEEIPKIQDPPPIDNKAIKVKTTLKCPKGTSLTYENFGEPFMLSYCTSCHSSAMSGESRAGAPEQINLDSHNEIVLWRIAIFNNATGRKLVVVKKDETKPANSPESEAEEIEEIEEKRTSPKMPPIDLLSGGEREELIEWLGCGAPGERGALNNP